MWFSIVADFVASLKMSEQRIDGLPRNSFMVPRGGSQLEATLRLIFVVLIEMSGQQDDPQSFCNIAYI